MTFRLETQRLLIRPLEPDDWPFVHAYISLSEVRFFVPEWPQTPEQTEEFVRRNVEEPRQFGLVERFGGGLVGHVGFLPWFGPRTYEIGWAVAPAYQGRGYATEAARAVLGHGFDQLELHRVIATCNPDNAASVRVMEKLGLRREAHFRQCVPRPDGSWSDEYLYAVLADEWPPADG